MVTASSPAASQIDRERHQPDGADGEHDAEAGRLRGIDAAHGDRPAAGAAHDRVDIAVIPHVDGARGPGADRDAEHRDRRQQRMDMAGGGHHAGDAGEDDERHHPGLQELQEIGDPRPFRRSWRNPSINS